MPSDISERISIRNLDMLVLDWARNILYPNIREIYMRNIRERARDYKNRFGKEYVFRETITFSG